MLIDWLIDFCKFLSLIFVLFFSSNCVCCDVFSSVQCFILLINRRSTVCNIVMIDLLMVLPHWVCILLAVKVERPVSSAIYFLMPAGTVSCIHRIPCTELWHFYAGDPLTVRLAKLFRYIQAWERGRERERERELHNCNALLLLCNSSVASSKLLRASQTAMPFCCTILW